MGQLAPIAKKQFLVMLQSRPEFFTKCTAPKVAKDTEEYNDGQTGRTKLHLSFVKNENITLSKPYDPVADKALLQWQQETFKAGTRFTVTVQPVQADLAGSPIPGAATLTLTECQLLSFKYPEVDRDGSGLAMLELELHYEDISVQ